MSDEANGAKYSLWFFLVNSNLVQSCIDFESIKIDRREYKFAASFRWKNGNSGIVVCSLPMGKKTMQTYIGTMRQRMATTTGLFVPQWR
jgi:hypothetical protein